MALWSAVYYDCEHRGARVPPGHACQSPYRLRGQSVCPVGVAVRDALSGTRLVQEFALPTRYAHKPASPASSSVSPSVLSPRHAAGQPRGPRRTGPPLLVGGIGPRMLKLRAQYADLWNTGFMGKPETMAEPLAKIEAACREVGRDPTTLGTTALVGLWFPDLQAQRPSAFDQILTGTVPELAASMRGYAELGVQHVMFQCEPYTTEARQRLTEALQLYRNP